VRAGGIKIVLCPSRDRPSTTKPWQQDRAIHCLFSSCSSVRKLALDRGADIVDAFVTLCRAQLPNTNATNNKQLAQWCDGKSGICMAINIPSTSSTDYYLAITAPQNIGYQYQVSCAYSISWASIGIGGKMANSLMFIIAQNNGNVSLSVRLTPYSPPDEGIVLM